MSLQNRTFVTAATTLLLLLHRNYSKYYCTKYSNPPNSSLSGEMQQLSVDCPASSWESEHFFCAFRKLLCCSWLVIYWFLFLCWHMQLYIYTFVSRFIRWSFFFKFLLVGGSFIWKIGTWSILCEEERKFAAADNWLELLLVTLHFRCDPSVC